MSYSQVQKVVITNVLCTPVYTATLTYSAMRMQSMYIKGISVAGMFYPRALHVYHNKDAL